MPGRAVADAVGNAPRPGCGLSRRQRITRPAEFDEAYRQNRKFVGRFMVLYVRTGERAGLRLGVVSSRKVGGAVERNRARRLIRETYRRQRAGLRGAADVVLVARAAIARARPGELAADFDDLALRSGLRVRNGRTTADQA
jgi:ribonuclease P protein component